MQYKKILVWIVLLTCIATGTMDIISIRPGEALRSMLALYFCIPLASLALTDSSKTYIKIGAVIGTIILLALSRFHIYPMIGGAVFVGGMLISILTHNTFLQERKQITSWGLAIAHTGIFSMVCAIAGSLSIVGSGKIDVTCEQVHGFANQHIASLLSYINISPEALAKTQERIDKFFNNTPEEVIEEQVQKQISNQMGALPAGDMSSSDIIALLKNNPSGSQQIGGLSALQIAELLKNNSQGGQLSPEATQQINNMIKGNTNELVIKTPDSSTLASNNPIAKKLQERAKNKQLITSTLGDRQELDDKICNVVFDQIKLWSTYPGFTRSILLTLILFFYPLIRLFAFICSGIISLVYMFLKSIGFISVIPEERIVETWVVGNGVVGKTLLSTLTLAPRTPVQSNQNISASHIAAQNATPPMPKENTSSGHDINDVLGGLESQGGGGGGTNSDHIVTANSPQDTDTIDMPHNSKKNDSPHIDFGSFGGNFDKKSPQKNNLD